MAEQSDLIRIADFLFEAGMLARTPRSGFQFLGSGKQSVAEHLNRSAYVGFSLASLDETVDVGKVVSMCLFHDFNEARVSDLNYVHQQYNDRREHDAVRDMTDGLPFRDHLRSLIGEYEERTSRESLLAKDADNIELVLSLKEQLDLGNERATYWIEKAVQRLKTDIGQALAKAILETASDHWWKREKGDDWWVNRTNGAGDHRQ